MPLSKEQLLIPRYLCTGTPGKPLWPGYHHNHGDIITNVRQVWINSFANEAPHLFKPLPWWYGRAVEELPEYVRIKSKILKVVKYRINDDEFVPDGKKIIKTLNGTTPATRDEYEEYLKQKEG